MRKSACLLSLLLFALVACKDNQPAVAVAQGAATPPSPVVRGRVEVEGGLVQLGFQVDGRISQVLVAEGDKVKRGQLLLAIDPTSVRLEGDVARGKLRVAEDNVRLFESRAKAARLRASRLQQAARADAADGQSADDAVEAAQQAGVELENARAEVQLARAEFARSEFHESQLQLHAPVDGEVLRIAAWAGMQASAQTDNLLTLLPARPRQVRVEIAENLVDQIKPGMRAKVISDDGLQTGLGDAHLLRVGETYGPTRLQQDPDQQVSLRSVEAVLAFDQPTSLRVGQRVLVRFDAGGR